MWHRAFVGERNRSRISFELPLGMGASLYTQQRFQLGRVNTGRRMNESPDTAVKTAMREYCLQDGGQECFRGYKEIATSF